MARRGRLWRVVIRPSLTPREVEQAVQNGIGIDASAGETVLVIDHVEGEDAARQRIVDVLGEDPRRIIAARPWTAAGLA